MKVLHCVSETADEIREVKRAGRIIGLVPTMGALHEGHMSLVRMGRNECGYLAVSLFVNPTQFGPSEDLDKYPRTLEADLEKCREAEVDLVFVPPAEEIYPRGFNSWVDVKGVSEVLEGEFRPGHYRGVTTVCSKLFSITCADCAYFGMKDYQQLKVIEKMVRDLNLHVHIVPVKIMREPDGLAMSSRNAYLSPGERKAALVLNKSLEKARKAYASGERNAAKIQGLVEKVIKAESLAAIDYAAVADAETLQPVELLESPAVVLLAVRIGSTRLIDNTLLK